MSAAVAMRVALLVLLVVAFAASTPLWLTAACALATVLPTPHAMPAPAPKEPTE